MEFKGMRVGIIGLGKRTGVITAITLSKLGAQVVVSDSKPVEKLSYERTLLAGISGISYDLGGHSQKVLDVDLIVVSPGVPKDIHIINEARQRSIEVIGEIELSYRLAQSPIIAITGTNGKTTTTSLIGRLLQDYSGDVFVGGNIGRPLIGEVLDFSALDLIVAEVSSFQLETIDSFHPEIAVLLNITPDHLDRHRTMEIYLKEKMNIFKNQTESDYCILNADDEILTNISGKIPSQIIWFSRRKKRIPGVYLDGEMMIAHIGEEPCELLSVHELKIKGNHNIENAMAASAAAILKGIKLDSIQRGLREFRGQEHTLEYVMTHNNVQFYNDSKGTNPDASVKALEAFDQPIVLIAGGLSRDLDFSDFMKTIQSKVKSLILLGETKEILRETALAFGFNGDIEVVESLDTAVRKSVSYSRPGDVVLFSPACASWDMFNDYAERGRLFKKYVKDYTTLNKGG